MQMIGRIRNYAPNPYAPHPILYFAFNGQIRSPHLQRTGIQAIKEFAEKQEHFAEVLRLYHGDKAIAPSEYIVPAKVWRDVFMYLAAQRQCLIAYPTETYGAVLRGNGWEVSDDTEVLTSSGDWNTPWHEDPPPEPIYS